MWLHVFEAWLTARVSSYFARRGRYLPFRFDESQLLASPTFHRVVRIVHRKVHEVRHGKDPSELGGTNDKTEESGVKKFFQYYLEELRDQFRNGASPRK